MLSSLPNDTRAYCILLFERARCFDDLYLFVSSVCEYINYKFNAKLLLCNVTLTTEETDIFNSNLLRTGDIQSSALNV